MTSKTTKILFFFSVIGFVFRIGSLNAQEYVSTIAQPGDFKIADQNSTCSIYTDTSDDWLIQKTASLFQDDLEKVTGKKPAIIHVIPASARNLIIIGSITQSKVLQQLIRSKKISVYSISNQWEAYQIEIVN